MNRIIFVLICLLSVNLFPVSKFYKVMEKSFVLIQAADIGTTYYLIGKGYEEGNPLAASYIHKPFIVVGIKAAITAGVLILCRKVSKKHGKLFPVIALTALNALGSYVIYNNLKVGQ